MCRKLMFLISLILLMLANNGSADMVLHWPLEDGSGTIATDVSGNGYDGTFNGAPEWVDGYFGGGLHFRGDAEADSVVYTVPGPATVWESGTIALWVMADSLGQDVWSSCFTNHTPNTAGIQFDVDGGNPGNYRLNPGGQFFGPATTEWTHLALTFEAGTGTFYYNGEIALTAALSDSQRTFNEFATGINRNHTNWLASTIDELRIYDHALAANEIQIIMNSAAGILPQARRPDPADGAVVNNTWVSMSWKSGDLAVSHDVYLGDNYDDVNNGTGDTFRGNQEGEFFIAGFPGNPYETGLVPGTTYYWRIDEVNETEPNSPWKGDVWSFSIPPKTAYNPSPAEVAEFVNLDVKLTWTPGFGAKLHFVAFGEDFDEVNNATGTLTGSASYSPGPLKLAKTYYWRVDESDGFETYKGQVWSFTTKGAVSGPSPADGAVDVKPSVVLRWVAGAVAESHEVYIGTDADSVKHATTASPEYKGPKALGDESYDPGKLTLNTTYYWRIDEVNDASVDSPWAGNVWSFRTGDFFVIDDFEDYDNGDNQIWYAWHDGLGYGAPGTEPYYAGNGTGAAVGDETTASYTEETIIHSGGKSMPVAYDNNKQGYAYYSEVEHTLTDQRDWTERGVDELSIWFRGIADNSAEPLYVVVSNSIGAPAVVVHDDANATQIDIWTQWVIPLQTFADQGINLRDVDRIAIGLGTQGNMTIPGGSGKMYFDDIRLYQPREDAE